MKTKKTIPCHQVSPAKDNQLRRSHPVILYSNPLLVSLNKKFQLTNYNISHPHLCDFLHFIYQLFPPS